MTMKIKYPKFKASVNIKVIKKKSIQKNREYIKTVASNIGNHGLFIETKRLYPKGALVKIEFNFSDSKQKKPEIQAKGIVMWNRRFFKPQGMGILLYEFINVRAEDFALTLLQLYEKEETIKR